MARLRIERFAPQYTVKRLGEADLAAVMALCQTNPLYYEYYGQPLTPEHLREDLTLLPPGKTQEDHYYVGCFEKGTLVALLNLIDGWPGPETAYIGLFMVDGRCAGQGRGSALIEGLCAYLRESGFAAVRLGYYRDNPQAAHFWKKCGFVPLRECQQEDGVLVLAERSLREETDV